MAGPLKIPYTQQFAPASTPVRKLRGVLRQHQGDCKQLTSAIASAFFAASHSPAKMAGNTIIALKYHGIIDANCAATPFGWELLNAPDDVKAEELLAKNILMNLDGISLVETLREMKQADAQFKLGTITEELRLRGYEVSDNSSDLSGVLNWLRTAGVLSEYDVNETRYSELVGVKPKTIDALKDLNEPQIAFLKAMVALGVDDWTPHNTVVAHAEALYAGQVQYNWKQLDITVLKPLNVAGFIEVRKAPKSTADARGGKAAEVKPTEKFEKDVADPILTPMYKAAQLRNIRKIRSIPLATLVENVRQKKDENPRGQSLEILAIRICQLLDLDFFGWRETDEELAGGGEVDGFMHTARLVYSRWQIQCKASDKITYETLAKAIGIAKLSPARAILIVGTGVMTPRATKFRQEVVSRTELCMIILDGNVLNAVAHDPLKLMATIARQDSRAMARRAC